MEKNDGSSSKVMGDVPQEQGESSAKKRIKCSIEEASFCCDNCEEPLRPPIFQCPEGHFFYCSSCRDDDDRRSLGMDRAVESILVDCHFAEHGCTEKTAYYHHAKHRRICPHPLCQCLEPGCDFAGKKGGLLDHLTSGHHKWPSTTFQYWVPFDLRIIGPGTHVLHCKNDGQIFLVNVQPAAEPPGLLAVSLGYVEYFGKPTAGFRCSVSFSYSARHRGTSTMPACPQSLSGSRLPICFVPNGVSAGPADDDAGVVLTVNISCVDAVDQEDDPDDSSYVESEATSDEDDRANY